MTSVYFYSLPEILRIYGYLELNILATPLKGAGYQRYTTEFCGESLNGNRAYTIFLNRFVLQMHKASPLKNLSYKPCSTL
jgi:hypothetical protein